MSSLPSWDKTAPTPTSLASDVSLQSQDEMKHWYENKVIVVLLIHCHPLEAKYCWPYVIESRLNELNYILQR
jgi:hypothetical protein